MILKVHIQPLVLLFLLGLSSVQTAQAQKKWKDKFELRGYVKYMHTATFDSSAKYIYTDQLIHNRLNFKYYANEHLTIVAEVRNRMFYGQTTALLQFGDQNARAKMTNYDPGFFKWSTLLWTNPSSFFVSKLDRGFVDYSKGKWQLRAGRQRINWGMNLFWNANDLFNAFELQDFDYEERPGTDAVSVSFFPTLMSTVEVVVAPGRTDNEWIAAGVYKFNKWQYDLQAVGGWWKEDIAIGGGWAGHVKDAGFKGEATYFHPQQSFADTTGALSMSISGEYIFPSSLYLVVGYLYNSRGSVVSLNEGAADIILRDPISAKNLLPYQQSALVSANYQFSPILNGSLVGFYVLHANQVFVMPSVGYSLHEDWEIALFGQFYFQNYGSSWGNPINAMFLRLKWSF